MSGLPADPRASRGREPKTQVKLWLLMLQGARRHVHMQDDRRPYRLIEDRLTLLPHSALHPPTSTATLPGSVHSHLIQALGRFIPAACVEAHALYLPKQLLVAALQVADALLQRTLRTLHTRIAAGCPDTLECGLDSQHALQKKWRDHVASANMRCYGMIMLFQPTCATTKWRDHVISANMRCNGMIMSFQSTCAAKKME